ncbi:LruC domain-containing protein [Polaribacter sp. R77954]|uniref:LruC domain-containing protein n=1 Tax=Polaribacter sp. R77954 TaxID=3093870 RepID=UPI0037CA56E6
MKTKLILSLLFLAFLQSCTPEFPDTPKETVEYIQDDITTLVVPTGHDLRPLALQNTNINLSENSRADMVNIKMFKVENETYTLMYEGFIDKNTTISNVIKVPNHVALIAVQADLATGTREWLVTPSEIQNLKIEDEERIDTEEGKTASSTKISAKSNDDNPPTWNCNDYAAFNGNDDGDYSISTTSTQGLNVNKKTTIYICNGGSWSPSYLNDNNNKLTIYVAQGGTLKLSGNFNSTIYNDGTFNGVNLGMSKDSEVDSWGITNITGNLNTDSKKVNVYGGTFNVSGSFNLNSNGKFYNDGGEVNIGGHFTTSGKFHNKENSALNVAGNFTVNAGEFENECRTIISGHFINNKQAEFSNASYTVITGSLINNSNIDIKIQEGSILKCASIMSNGKIKGDKAYSVIETGKITFNGNNSFQGSLDICSDYYTESMGKNDVINTCSTFISVGACSPGFNSAIDNDNDGVIEGVDVDDANPNVSSYNYPQGQNTYFTSLYEDLYPCMGDYDLNDLVHNYSYKEGVNQNAMISQIEFDYKFPAMGANFNNSFVLRVIDEDDDAVLTLNNTDAYASTEITRLHDSQNNTTLFIFNNLKTIYTDQSGAIINTVNIDYDNIPVISGKVTNINGAYDEFMLKNGELGQEIHPLYNSFHKDYPALNAPTMYNDSSNFLNCSDNSSGNSLFVNSNKFPWVLNDLPVDLPWATEGVSILEAYPNFDDFVISKPGLDWYTDKNGNRRKDKLKNINK